MVRPRVARWRVPLDAATLVTNVRVSYIYASSTAWCPPWLVRVDEQRGGAAAERVRLHDMACWLKSYNPRMYRRVIGKSRGERQLREWFEQLDPGVWARSEPWSPTLVVTDKIAVLRVPFQPLCTRAHSGS